MISLETTVALAIQHPLVMDQVGEALRSDIVVANPYLRRIAEFADTFLLQRQKLPSSGDWEVWLGSLEAGMLQDGTREALSGLLAMDVSMYDPAYFAETVITDLQKAAAEVARVRLNEMPVMEPETVSPM